MCALCGTHSSECLSWCGAMRQVSVGTSVTISFSIPQTTCHQNSSLTKKMFSFSLPQVPVVFNSNNTSALDDRQGRQLMLPVHYHQMQVTLTSSFSTTLADNASRRNVWWAKTLLQRIHSVLDWFQKPKIVVQWTLQWVMGSQVLSTFVSRTSPLNTAQTECSASAHTHIHNFEWQD